MDRNETITAIRTALKNRSGKQWSVTGGRGTAWGWISISSPKSRLGCALPHNFDRLDECQECGESRFTNGWLDCPKHECTPRCCTGYMVKADRDELSELLGVRVDQSGVSIPSSGSYYNEYVARAAGLTPIKVGVPYWD